MQKEKKKFYQAKWFLWLWLILFPPVGIILLWTCHKEMKTAIRIILSVVFAIWFAILMSATNGDSPTSPTTDTNPPATTSAIEVEESSVPAQEESTSSRELTTQDIEDACFSFFTDVVLKAYGEIPWGVGQENGATIDSTNLSEDLKSGEVTVSYVLEEEPHSGVNLSIVFAIDGERVGVSEILVDGAKQEIPDDAKDSVLIWLLLDANYTR